VVEQSPSPTKQIKPLNNNDKSSTDDMHTVLSSVLSRSKCVKSMSILQMPWWVTGSAHISMQT
jgi:hypothetical protein